MAMNMMRLLSSSSQLLKQATICPRANLLAGARSVTLKVVQKQPELEESYDERNMRLQRVQSPHLTIYKPQLTSMLSITHRFTGLALAGYVATLGLGALILPHDFNHYITMIEGLKLGGGTLFTLKFILAYPAGYHVANGIRHLFWDSGAFLKIKEVYSTGYVMVAASFALTTLLALL